MKIAKYSLCAGVAAMLFGLGGAGAALAQQPGGAPSNLPLSTKAEASAPFGLSEGINFAEYDLIYLQKDLLFWGTLHVDGRGFDSEQNRPTNLQVPLVRTS